MLYDTLTSCQIEIANTVQYSLVRSVNGKTLYFVRITTEPIYTLLLVDEEMENDDDLEVKDAGLDKPENLSESTVPSVVTEEQEQINEPSDFKKEEQSLETDVCSPVKDDDNAFEDWEEEDSDSVRVPPKDDFLTGAADVELLSASVGGEIDTAEDKVSDDEEADAGAGAGAPRRIIGWDEDDVEDWGLEQMKNESLGNNSGGDERKG